MPHSNTELASNTCGLGREREGAKRGRKQLSHLGDASILAALLQPVPLSQPDLHSINCQPGDFYINCSARNKLPCTQEMKPLPRIYHLSTVFFFSEYKRRATAKVIWMIPAAQICVPATTHTCKHILLVRRIDDPFLLHTHTFTLTRQKRNTFFLDPASNTQQPETIDWVRQHSNILAGAE